MNFGKLINKIHKNIYNINIVFKISIVVFRKVLEYNKIMIISYIEINSKI
jgi:hypothetical protein